MQARRTWSEQTIDRFGSDQAEFASEPSVKFNSKVADGTAQFER
jgi:hypothetical protein